MPIQIKIDCTLITKSKLFHGKKVNSENKLPQYLDVILIETPNNQYADFMAVEALSKDEKARGIKQGKKLGTAKHFGRSKASNNSRNEYPGDRPVNGSIDDYM